MPELFDIDSAFDELVDDVTHRTRPLGADRVATAARRRRTTRVAAGALVLLVGGAGAVFWPHQGDNRGLDPAGGVPAPQVLTPAVLDRVTAGWVSDWFVPTKPTQIPDDLQTAGDTCLNSLLDDTGMSEDEYGSGPTGSSLLMSGRSLALVEGGQTTSDYAARRLTQWGNLSKTCRNARQSTPNGHTSLLTASAADSAGHAVFAAARWHDRFALVAVSGPSHGGSAGVQDALGTALLAAIQEDSTVTVMSPVLKAMRVSQTADSSGSGSAHGLSTGGPSYSMTYPTSTRVAQALGSWAAGYDSVRGMSRPLGPPSCIDDRSASGESESVGNAAMVGLSTYASPDDADGGQRMAAASLAACGFRVEGPTATSGLVVATRGGARPMTMWFQRSGIHVATLQVDGWSDPPASVTSAVDRLLTAALATVERG